MTDSTRPDGAARDRDKAVSAPPPPGEAAREGAEADACLLLNCPKCRLPIALYLEVCPACGVVIAELPSVDRPARP